MHKDIIVALKTAVSLEMYDVLTKHDLDPLFMLGCEDPVDSKFNYFIRV